MPGIVVGIIEGGPEPGLFRESAFARRLMREFPSAPGDSEDWSVNVVFIIPGRLSRPDFAGVRTGKFSRSAGQLMVQVAVPDRPFATGEAIAEWFLGSLEAATREADEFYRLEGMGIDLSDAWGQIGALRRELELKPKWAVDLPDEPVDHLTPEERAVLEEFEATRAEAAPIRAKLRLRKTRRGGRHFPVASGHATECWLGVIDEWEQRVLEPIILYVEHGGSVQPGQSALVRVHPVVRTRWSGVTVGTVLEIREGSKVVGEATITELLEAL